MYTSESVFRLTTFASTALAILLLLLFTWMHKGKIAKCQGSIPGLYTYVQDSTQISIVFWVMSPPPSSSSSSSSIRLNRRGKRVSERRNAFCHDEDEYDVHQTVKMSSFVWIWFMCQSFCVYCVVGVACLLYLRSFERPMIGCVYVWNANKVSPLKVEMPH